MSLPTSGQDGASMSRTAATSVEASGGSERTQYCICAVWLVIPYEAFRFALVHKSHIIGPAETDQTKQKKKQRTRIRAK